MITLLSFLVGWAEGWTASGRPDISVSWEQSPADRDKRSAWMAVQGPAAWGQITVWETGEVALEAISTEHGEVVLSDHLTVSGEEQLAGAIRRLIAGCEV